MKRPFHTDGFTLLELLVAIAILAVLAALIFPAMDAVRRNASQTAGLSNMRQVGMAMIAYAGEHNYQLPGRETGKDGNDRWPKLIAEYLKDHTVYAAPGDPQNYIRRNVDPLDNVTNNTSYIMNGYNDLGTFQQPNMDVRMTSIEYTSNTLLLGTPKTGSIHFFMDFLEPPHGNNKDILNLTMYGDGSNYFFVDGSARFIKETEYRDALWLVDKDFQIPKM